MLACAYEHVYIWYSLLSPKSLSALTMRHLCAAVWSLAKSSLWGGAACVADLSKGVRLCVCQAVPDLGKNELVWGCAY